MLLPSKLEPVNEDCASLEDNEQESQAEERRFRLCFGGHEARGVAHTPLRVRANKSRDVQPL